MKVGYVRVSTVDQNTGRQEVLMKELGVDKIYVDKQSGKNKERPQLQEMLNFVREGDVLVVESISRLARNVKDLLEIVDQLKQKGVVFISKKETIDTSTPAGEFMLTVFGALAQLERSYILERQAEGIALAKAQGKYNGRPRIEVDEDKFIEYYKDYQAGYLTGKGLCKKLGISLSTFHRRVKDYEKKYGVNLSDKTKE